MKLLFDENLSPKLPRLLGSRFPGSLHLRDCGLKGATDDRIWKYAAANQFMLISKDSDFYHRGLFEGAPPKIVWLRIGNCTRDELVTLISSHAQELDTFDQDSVASVLALS